MSLMQRRAFVIAAGAALVACNPLAATDFGYRITLSVMDGDEVRTGESVIHLRYQDLTGTALAKGAANEVYLWAEAPFIDLGARGVLVATLRSADNLRPFLSAPMRQRAEWRSMESADKFRLVREVARSEDEFVLQLSELPRFAHFARAADPMSARLIDPGRLAEQVSGGIRFTSLKIKITHAHATEKIRRVFPWLNGDAVRFPGPRTDPLFSYSDFRTWGPSTWM